MLLPLLPLLPGTEPAGLPVLQYEELADGEAGFAALLMKAPQ